MDLGTKKKKQILPYGTSNWLLSITVVESVYSAVRTGSLNKADTLLLEKVNLQASNFSSRLLLSTIA